ncbi:hypothetical protein [Rheinheimera sp. F8]|uniref:hypothetical protein n=1 Tax=Rheinheimera sp. F8 TaxID=1763998 RepID=UPI000A6CE9F4|nr:hypothetical protein [Rheinheimera sp. F8]
MLLESSLAHQPVYLSLLRAANWGLLLSVCLFIATVLICYPFEQLFSLPQLVVGHVLLIASATLIKICYVCRCIALYGLAREVC